MRPTPVKNIVSEISLSKKDVFLPIFELVANSVISTHLKYGKHNKELGQISIEITRKVKTKDSLIPEPITTFRVSDNGSGFNTKNFSSFETPHSHTYKNLGCKGMGRFTCLAAFEQMEIESYFQEEDVWKSKKFTFDPDNEITELDREDVIEEFKTVVTLSQYRDSSLEENTTVETDVFAEALLNHCLVFYLSGMLPTIIVKDSMSEQYLSLNDMFEALKKDNEKPFAIKGYHFQCYIIRTKKKGRRSTHYVHYCANSREVGSGKSLSKFDKLFKNPILEGSDPYYLDVYVVSEYLDDKNNLTRNAFNIPSGNFEEDSVITFRDIDQKISEKLREEFHDYYIKSQEKSIKQAQEYIKTKGVEYRRYINRNDILKALPPFADDKTIDEQLHKIAYEERRSIDKKMDEFIRTDVIDEEFIANISNELKKKTVFDSDGLAHYILRRKAVIQLFDKLLEANKEGDYQLEESIHNLILPMGLEGKPYELAHNLWLLDERFVSYSYVASDKTITSISDKKSRLEPDTVLLNNESSLIGMPTAFADRPSGKLNSLVIFEFKRPGETAWQKSKTDFQWEYSELVQKYLDAFLYGSSKKNYKGRPVVVEKTTPKFGYVILDDIPTQLASYNEDKGFKKTPYGTWYRMAPAINLHIEVITFDQLIENAHLRHKPFFDQLFKNN